MKETFSGAIFPNESVYVEDKKLLLALIRLMYLQWLTW